MPASRPPATPATVELWGVELPPEIGPGDDLAALIMAAEPALMAGDILVVTSKIVSKSEGRVRTGGRAAAVQEETRRVIARRGETVIVETRLGLVMAQAGVDESNTTPGTALLLPEDPDRSAREIRSRLPAGIGVIVSDTFGRPWREGQTDQAIGAAGVRPLLDHRGTADAFGNRLEVTVTALADELSAAGDLVKGKATGMPVAVVRGLGSYVTEEDGPGAAVLIRPPDQDMFRYGSADVLSARRTIRSFSDAPVDGAAVRRAVSAALTAPARQDTTPWRFVLVESAATRKRLIDALLEAGRTEAVDVLRDAPQLVIPCMVASAAQDHPAALISMGAGLQNFLVSLAVEGLGSAWDPATTSSSVIRAELDLPDDWAPVGTVAIGHPATPPEEHPPHDPADFLLTR